MTTRGAGEQSLGQRVFATLFIVGFFVALPLWFLSTLEGWITIDCKRAVAANAMACSVEERFAFGSQKTEHTAFYAAPSSRSTRGRGTAVVTYQLELDTPHGKERVLHAYTGNTDLALAAADLGAAIRRGAPEFHAAIAPDGVFWFAVGLVAIFGGAGLLIARSAHPERQGPRR